MDVCLRSMDTGFMPMRSHDFPYFQTSKKILHSHWLRAVFPSNVYPFGAFIGSCPKLLSYVIKRLTFDRALPALLSISSTCALIPTHVRLYLLNILRWIKSWKVYYFIAVVMFIMSDQESSIQPTASPATSVATIAIW